MIFSDLKIYDISIRLAKDVESLVSDIPYNWKIKEVKQILRSSSSIPANIAEGFAKKIYQKEFIRFLYIALGSSDETQCHISLLHIKKHISEEKYKYFLNQYKNLSIKILNLINAIKKNIKIPINNLKNNTL